MVIYLIGSLRHPEVPNIASKLRGEGFDVFDEWYAAGPTADDCWRDYEKARGWTYEKAVRESAAAEHVFDFDYRHLERSEEGILILPAGKSGHMELGWLIGRGKRGYILLDTPDRWDIMYKFATLVTTDLQEIINDIQVGHTISGPIQAGRIVEQGPIYPDGWGTNTGTLCPISGF
jgi:hypothetical protein